MMLARRPGHLAQDLIPNERLWINLDYMTEEHRQMRFNAHGKRYDELLEGIRQSMFGGA